MKALLANDASLAGHHGSALVTEQIVTLAAKFGISVCSGKRWEAVESLLNGGSEFDLLIVNGEGSLHHDSRSAKRIAEIGLRAKSIGLPAYLINTTEEANSAEVLSGIAAFRKVYARDTTTQSRLTSIGIEAGFVPDLTLSWIDARRYEPQNVILVTDSSDAQKTDRLLQIARTIGASTQAISFRAPPPLLSRRLQFEFKRLLAMALPTAPWTVRYSASVRTRNQLVEKMRRAKGVICGRYHAVCFCLLLRVPFIAIPGNTKKIDSLLGDIGLSRRLIDLQRLIDCSKSLGNSYHKLIPNFDSRELELIEDFTMRARIRAESMFREIAMDASGLRVAEK